MSEIVLQECAMLVSLNIRQWTARKHDKSVSTEVDTTHGAKGGGRYNKLLIRKEALDPIAKIESAARAHLYKMTKEWGENGERIMAANLAMQLSQDISDFRTKFNAEVNAFVAAYPTLKLEAAKYLGTMYDPNDYPLDIRSKFEFSPLRVSPIADVNDFRVNLSEGYVRNIREEYKARQDELLQGMVKDLWKTLREHVEKIVEVCSVPKSKIFDSLMDGPKSFLALLPAMNITKDVALNAAAHELSTILVPAERLRQDKGLKTNTARYAQELLTKIP